MSDVVVSEQALRELVNEALDGVGYGDLTVPDQDPIEPNAVVDPSVADTDPVNSSPVPHNRVELDVALKRLSKDVPDDLVPNIYKTAKAAIAIEKEKREEGDAMKTENEQQNVEEVVRKQVREVVLGMQIEQRPRRAYKPTAIGCMADVAGASFDEIAESLGFSVAGAKQAVDKALLKAQAVARMDQDDLEIVVLTAMNEYINMLSKSGELLTEEVSLLKNNPEIVRELDGFREYLHPVLKRAQRDGLIADVPHSED